MHKPNRRCKRRTIYFNWRKNLEAGFNPKYFLDSLKVIDDEEVYVEFGSSISPCLIKSTENNDYVYMILPIRIKED